MQEYADIQNVDLEMAFRKMRVARGLGVEGQSKFSKRYWNDPVAFVHDCIRWPYGKRPTPYQDEILGEIATRRRVAIYGPRGLGKTTLESWLILWFSLTRDGMDWKAPTTAGGWRQLTKYLWPEVRKWARLLRWDRIGRPMFDDRTEMLQLSLKLKTGEAFAVASDVSDLTEGAHAEEMYFSFDEAKSVPTASWDSAEGSFSMGSPIVVAASTPGSQDGRFYQICSHKPGFDDWWVRHVTMEEVVLAGRMDMDWAEQRKRQWGEDNPLYVNHVLGEFVETDETALIPWTWVEAANERWQEVMDALANEENYSIGPLTAVGVDVSDGGGDRTVLALRHGSVITELRETRREDVMATTGRVSGILTQAGRHALAVVDSIGVGAGVVARLRELKHRVYAFNASEGTLMRDRSGEMGYINKRSAAWWRMREILDPEWGRDIALPPHDLLLGDLTAPHWKVTSSGKIQIESKDDLRVKLERSTDFGDAVVQAFWVDGPGGTAEIGTKQRRWQVGEQAFNQDEDNTEIAMAEGVYSPSRWHDAVAPVSRWRGK